MMEYAPPPAKLEGLIQASIVKPAGARLLMEAPFPQVILSFTPSNFKAEP